MIQSYGNGGAIRLTGIANLTADSNTFLDIEAVGGKGGALYIQDSSNITVASSLFYLC